MKRQNCWFGKFNCKHKKIHGFNTDIFGFLKSLSKNTLHKNIIIIRMVIGSAIYNYLKNLKEFYFNNQKKIKKRNTKVIRTLEVKNIDFKKLFNCKLYPLGSNLKKSFIKETL